MKKTLAIFLLSAFTCALADQASTTDLLPANNTVNASQQQEGSPSAKSNQPKLIIVKPSSTSPSYAPPSKTSKHSKSKQNKNKSHSKKKKTNTSKQSKKTSKQKKHKPSNQ